MRTAGDAAVGAMDGAELGICLNPDVFERRGWGTVAAPLSGAVRGRKSKRKSFKQKSMSIEKISIKI